MAFDPNKYQTEGDSGGRESKPYSATVIDAWFEEKDYGPQLVLQNRLDEADLMDYAWMASGEDKRWFGCGKIQVERGKPFVPWSIVGSGAAIKGDTDDRMFRGDSDLGRLWAQVLTLPNVSELPEDFDPRVAASWKGLHFRWGPCPVTKRVQVDGEWKAVAQNMDLPVELGSGSVVAVEDVDLDTLGLTGEQIDALSKLSTPGTDDSTFVGAAMSVPGVMANAAVVKVLTSNPRGLRQSLPF